MELEIAELIKDYQYKDSPKMIYQLEVNSLNCNYEIDVNDFPIIMSRDNFPFTHYNPSLNNQILKSGKQTVSVKIFPLDDKTINEETFIELNLTAFCHSDNLSQNSDFKGNTILKWKIFPKEKSLLTLNHDTIFKATVPYDLSVLKSYHSDLSKIDENQLFEEVLKQFENRKRENNRPCLE